MAAKPKQATVIHRDDPITNKIEFSVGGIPLNRLLFPHNNHATRALDNLRSLCKDGTDVFVAFKLPVGQRSMLNGKFGGDVLDSNVNSVILCRETLKKGDDRRKAWQRLKDVVETQTEKDACFILSVQAYLSLGKKSGITSLHKPCLTPLGCLDEHSNAQNPSRFSLKKLGRTLVNILCEIEAETELFAFQQPEVTVERKQESPQKRTNLWSKSDEPEDEPLLMGAAFPGDFDEFSMREGDQLFIPHTKPTFGLDFQQPATGSNECPSSGLKKLRTIGIGSLDHESSYFTDTWSLLRNDSCFKENGFPVNVSGQYGDGYSNHTNVDENEKDTDWDGFVQERFDNQVGKPERYFN